MNGWLSVELLINCINFIGSLLILEVVRIPGMEGVGVSMAPLSTAFPLIRGIAALETLFGQTPLDGFEKMITDVWVLASHIFIAFNDGKNSIVINISDA